MKLNRKLVMVLALVLSVAMATSGTMAYLSDTDSDVNVMTLGSVEIDQKEQQRKDYTEAVDQDELIDFAQSTPLYPAVYEGEKIEVGSGAWDVITGNQNVVDKIVTVTNTGKSDAYVRTIIAYEGNILANNEVIIVDNRPDDVIINEIQNVEIDGIKYDVVVYTYKAALAPNATTDPSLKQVYMNKKCDNAEVEKYGDTYEILVLSQAVQTQGFDNAEQALNEGFATLTADNIAGWMKGLASKTPASDEELEDALKEDANNIVVRLSGDTTYDVAAWMTDAMGGANTETITIVGNGHTLTFNQTNSDWNNIVTNGAKLIIRDAHITNSGYNDGPWNRHDLNFGCDVELINVTSDKALAFKAGANLKNVTISDANASDTYAIWIQPNGQTVTLDGCTIDMLDCTDGRGIKIDEQYVSAPEKVTLNVKNTTFKTEEKAAIIVKSVAGADINLENVNISKVADDPANEVWVDEASAAYADKVTVKGGSKIVEPQKAEATTDADLNTAISNGATYIELGSGNYIIPDSAQGKNLTIVGNGDTVVAAQDDGAGEGDGDYSFDGSTVTFANLTINFKANGYHSGFPRAKVTYKNCVINNTFSTYSDSSFVDCTLNVSGDAYNVWTWGASNVSFENCTFNSDGKALLLYGTANTKLTVNNCTFNDKGGLTDKKAAIEIGNDYNKSYELIVNNTTVNGYEINDNGINTGTTLWANKNSMGKDKLNVVVDGVDVY